LQATSKLKDWGKDGNSGSLDLGLHASTQIGARAVLDYKQSISKDWGNMSAFAQAYAGLTRNAFGKFAPDAGITAGLRLEW